MIRRTCVGEYYRYVFMVLVAYAWAMMPLLFLLSFCFREATSAYVWVTVINLVSSTYVESLTIVPRLHVLLHYTEQQVLAAANLSARRNCAVDRA